MFLDPAERAAVGSGDAFRPSLYKVLLFQRVAQAIKSGSINLSHSIKFRPLDGYMIGIDHWRRERDDLLAQAGMTAFSSHTEVLKTLEAALADQFAKTNGNIEAGANAHVKRMPSGHLSLKRPSRTTSIPRPCRAISPSATSCRSPKSSERSTARRAFPRV